MKKHLNAVGAITTLTLKIPVRAKALMGVIARTNRRPLYQEALGLIELGVISAMEHPEANRLLDELYQELGNRERRKLETKVNRLLKAGDSKGGR